MCFYIPPVRKIENRAVSAGRFSACAGLGFAVQIGGTVRRSPQPVPVKDNVPGYDRRRKG